MLHRVLLDDKESFPKESFYTKVESMILRLEESSELKNKFQKLVDTEPKIEIILKERLKDLVEYFEEVLEYI